MELWNLLLRPINHQIFLLAHEAFSSSTYRKLWARFPTTVLDKLVKIPGEDAERLKGILQREVKKHARKIRDRREALFPTSTNEKRILDIQEQTLKLQELTLKEKQKSSHAKEQDKKEESLVLAETEANLFLGECSVLSDIMPEDDWKEADDGVISDAVRRLSKGSLPVLM